MSNEWMNEWMNECGVLSVHYMCNICDCIPFCLYCVITWGCWKSCYWNFHVLFIELWFRSPNFSLSDVTVTVNLFKMMAVTVTMIFEQQLKQQHSASLSLLNARFIQADLSATKSDRWVGPTKQYRSTCRADACRAFFSMNLFTSTDMSANCQPTFYVAPILSPTNLPVWTAHWS